MRSRWYGRVRPGLTMTAELIAAIPLACIVAVTLFVLRRRG